MDEMKLLEQRAQVLAAEAEADKPNLKKDILFVRLAPSPNGPDLFPVCPASLYSF